MVLSEYDLRSHVPGRATIFSGILLHPHLGDSEVS
jgi:hypothetical protein